MSATITAADGQICTVQLTDGRSFVRHRDHVKHRACSTSGVSGQADLALPQSAMLVPPPPAPAPTALEARTVPLSAALEAPPALTSVAPGALATSVPTALGTPSETASFALRSPRQYRLIRPSCVQLCLRLVARVGCEVRWSVTECSW